MQRGPSITLTCSRDAFDTRYSTIKSFYWYSDQVKWSNQDTYSAEHWLITSLSIWRLENVFPHFRKVKCSDNVCNIYAQQFVETNRPGFLINLLSKHRTPPLQVKFQGRRDLLTHNQRSSLLAERETLIILSHTHPYSKGNSRLFISEFHFRAKKEIRLQAT